MSQPTSDASRRENVNACLKWERRHCEEPTGRANARPMTGSATKQSIFHCCTKAGLLRFARNDDQTQLRILAARYARGLPEIPTLQSEGAGNAGRSARPQPRVQW